MSHHDDAAAIEDRIDEIERRLEEINSWLGTDEDGNNLSTDDEIDDYEIEAEELKEEADTLAETLEDYYR